MPNDKLRRVMWGRSRGITCPVMVLEATLILVPQKMERLGEEFIAINLILLLWHLTNTYQFHYKNKEIGSRRGFSINFGIRFIASDILGIVGGVGLIKLSNWALYLITASYLVLLFTVIFAAWNIMLGVGREQETKKTG
jgi:hypothetical protein